MKTKDGIYLPDFYYEQVEFKKHKQSRQHQSSLYEQNLK